MARSRQLFPPKNLILIKGVCLSGWHRGDFVKATLSLPPPAVISIIWRVACLEGLEVLATYNYGWDRLCQWKEKQ